MKKLVVLQSLIFLMVGPSFCSQVNHALANDFQKRKEAMENILRQEVKKGTHITDINNQFKVLSENTQEYKKAVQAARKKKEYFAQAKKSNCVDDMSILNPISLQWKKHQNVIR